jgi:hypothetical protein
MLEPTGLTEQLAPDFAAWLRKILSDAIPYMRGISSEGVDPKALPASTPAHHAPAASRPAAISFRWQGSKEDRARHA